jgi:chromosomal replication initiator protein
VASAEHLWGACVDVLRTEMPDSVAKTWLEAAHPRLEGHRLFLGVPHPAAKERIENRYQRFVEGILEDVAGEHHEIVLEVRTDLAPAIGREDDAGYRPDGVSAPAPAPVSAPAPAPVVHDRVAVARGTGDRVAGGGAPADFGSLGEIDLNPAYTFEGFVIGESNRFAAAAALAVAEKPATSFNPLFIYGDAGLGKTHLLHAIGHYVRANYPGKYVRYVSTEHFLNDFIEAIRTNSQSAFKLRYRRCDVLLVDDVQLIENKEHTQEEFFHTFDFLHSAGRQIVISSDRPPKAMATLEDRLRSRFGWGLITDVQPPHLETRLAILRKKAELEPTHVTDDVLTYIATHITNNIRELEGALNRVIAFSNLNGVPLTLQMPRTSWATSSPPRPPARSRPRSSSTPPPRCSGSASTTCAGRAAAARSSPPARWPCTSCGR